MAFTEARLVKIPDKNGGVNIYPVMDARNKRARKNITNNLANLSTAIAEQNLQKYGYDIGDYFKGPSGYEYIIADENTFHGRNFGETGDYTALTYAVVVENHITIVVNTRQNVQWNTSATTQTGYNGSNLHSYMVNTVLPKVKSDLTSLFGSWDNHLIAHQKLMTTSAGGWAWQSGQYISALTSVQLHGSPICDLNFYSTGEGNKPLAVFQKYFYPDVLGNQHNWLRSIATDSASAGCPCGAYDAGYAAGDSHASDSLAGVGLIIFK